MRLRPSASSCAQRDQPSRAVTPARVTVIPRGRSTRRSEARTYRRCRARRGDPSRGVAGALLHPPRVDPLGETLGDVVIRLLRFVPVTRLPLDVREPDERRQVDRVRRERAVVVRGRAGEIVRAVIAVAEPGKRLGVVRVLRERRRGRGSGRDRSRAPVSPIPRLAARGRADRSGCRCRRRSIARAFEACRERAHVDAWPSTWPPSPQEPSACAAANALGVLRAARLSRWPRRGPRAMNVRNAPATSGDGRASPA